MIELWPESALTESQGPVPPMIQARSKHRKADAGGWRWYVAYPLVSLHVAGARKPVGRPPTSKLSNTYEIAIEYAK